MKLDIDLEWTLRSACRNTDPELFFPAKQSVEIRDVREALDICGTCPVRSECLAYAYHFEGSQTDRFGIYGGYTARQRNAIAKERYGTQIQQLAHDAPAAIVRAWAAANGFIVATTGNIPNRVRLAYAFAMNDNAPGATA